MDADQTPTPPLADEAWQPSLTRDEPLPPPAFHGDPDVPPERQSVPKSSHRARRTAAAGVAVLAIASAGFTAGRSTLRTKTIVQTAASGSTSANVQTASATSSTSGTVASAAAAVLPAVVNIEVDNGQSSGVGAGVIYDRSGHILTVAHLVSGSSTVTVELSDGTKVTGTVLGADTTTDIAVVKIDMPSSITPAALGTATSLVVGESVVAIGSPFGLAETVTSGIVSTVSREVDGQKLIQTDAAINPGNSGGPLVNLAGQVIGINTAIYSDSGDNTGVGFAIPISTALSVANQIVANASHTTT
jgi:putative serine protease PepD